MSKPVSNESVVFGIVMGCYWPGIIGATLGGPLGWVAAVCGSMAIAHMLEKHETSKGTEK